MKVAVFSTKPYDRQFLEAANTDYGHDLRFFEPRLNHETSTLAAGYAAVCVFVNDQLDASVLTELAQEGTRLIALRCAGFNNVNLTAARELGLTVVQRASVFAVCRRRAYCGASFGCHPQDSPRL